MPAKRAVLETAEAAGFPVTRHDLLARLEAAGVADDVLAVVHALADDRFVSPAELEERLDDALGMPSADPDDTALTATTEWREGES